MLHGSSFFMVFGIKYISPRFRLRFIQSHRIRKQHTVWAIRTTASHSQLARFYRLCGKGGHILRLGLQKRDMFRIIIRLFYNRASCLFVYQGQTFGTMQLVIFLCEGFLFSYQVSFYFDMMFFRTKFVLYSFTQFECSVVGVSSKIKV